MELYRKHRPTEFKEVIGQDQAVRVLQTKLTQNSVPHVVLFTGPTGVGKTTLARILADKLECFGYGLQEINCADFRGIDTVRDIRDGMGMAPLTGKTRVWILDEVVQLPKTTQQAALKLLEDVPTHVYFFLCTTDTSGLLPTFLGRCFQVKLSVLSAGDLSSILNDVLLQEQKSLSAKVQVEICMKASGSARNAIQLLELVLTQNSEEDQLRAISFFSSEDEELTESLARLIVKRAKWSEIAPAIKNCPDASLEKIRRGVLGYVTAIMLSGKSDRYLLHVIREFEEPWFNSGKAGLTAAAWECCQYK